MAYSIQGVPEKEKLHDRVSNFCYYLDMLAARIVFFSVPCRFQTYIYKLNDLCWSVSRIESIDQSKIY